MNADLTGCAVLIVEDNYFVAIDTQRALQAAGAIVFGPAVSEQDALRTLQTVTPTVAIVDVNLGYGPSFVVASELKHRHIPFLFVTGYNDTVIPDEFESIKRLDKPVPMEEIVKQIAHIKADLQFNSRH
jgi:ActR/RegA family two-component response regulator